MVVIDQTTLADTFSHRRRAVLPAGHDLVSLLRNPLQVSVFEDANVEIDAANGDQVHPVGTEQILDGGRNLRTEATEIIFTYLAQHSTEVGRCATEREDRPLFARVVEVVLVRHLHPQVLLRLDRILGCRLLGTVTTKGDNQDHCDETHRASHAKYILFSPPEGG